MFSVQFCVDKLYNLYIIGELANLIWDGNTDFQFCFDFDALITYITEYFTNDDNGVIVIRAILLEDTQIFQPTFKSLFDLTSPVSKVI